MFKTKLTEEQLKKIKDSVKKAESKSSGEIVTAFIRESDSYAVYELLFSVISAFVIFTISLFYFTEINSFFSSMFWDYTISNSVMCFGFSAFLLIFIIYFLANLPFLDRIIVPSKVMKEKVKNRALKYFLESGVYETRDRTGILIFISILERKVELIADSGIASKIEQKSWDEIVNLIVEGIKSGNWVDNLAISIEKCGDLLEEHFPIAEDDENELHDGIVFLKR